MRIMAVAVTLLMLSPYASADIYKCVENGKTIYAERPCGAKAIVLTSTESPEQVRRLQEEAAVRQQSQDAVAETLRKDRARPSASREKYIPPPALQAQPNRCAVLAQQIQDAKDDMAVYSINSSISARARIDKKRAEDAHFSECFGARN